MKTKTRDKISIIGMIVIVILILIASRLEYLWQ